MKNRRYGIAWLYAMVMVVSACAVQPAGGDAAPEPSALAPTEAPEGTVLAEDQLDQCTGEFELVARFRGIVTLITDESGADPQAWALFPKADAPIPDHMAKLYYPCPAGWCTVVLDGVEVQLESFPTQQPGTLALGSLANVASIGDVLAASSMSAIDPAWEPYLEPAPPGLVARMPLTEGRLEGGQAWNENYYYGAVPGEVPLNVSPLEIAKDFRLTRTIEGCLKLSFAPLSAGSPVPAPLVLRSDGGTLTLAFSHDPTAHDPSLSHFVAHVQDFVPTAELGKVATPRRVSNGAGDDAECSPAKDKK